MNINIGDQHVYELSDGAMLYLSDKQANELRLRINHHLGEAAAKRMEDEKFQADTSAEHRDLVEKFLRKIALACVDMAIFEALCRVFAATVEGFEKPTTADVTTFIPWEGAPPVPVADIRAAYRTMRDPTGFPRRPLLVGQEAYDLLPAHAKELCEPMPIESDLGCDCCCEDDDEEYYDAGGEFISPTVFPPHDEKLSEISYTFARGGKKIAERRKEEETNEFYDALARKAQPLAAMEIVSEWKLDSDGRLEVQVMNDPTPKRHSTSTTKWYKQHATAYIYAIDSAGVVVWDVTPDRQEKFYSAPSVDVLTQIVSKVVDLRKSGMTPTEETAFFDEYKNGRPPAECPECWGSGHYHGWGADCTRGCVAP